MTLFKPCIDLHKGKVKQIVGETLSGEDSATKVNFESDKPSRWFAELFQKDGLTGGHLIQLGPGNKEAAREALQEYPGGMQIGGGVNPDNAEEFLQAGASHVIITSWFFPELFLDKARLSQMKDKLGKDKIVLDLSCKRVSGDWYITKDKWQTLTEEKLTSEFLEFTADYCSEYLIHAADVEGKVSGIDEELVEFLGKHTTLPLTYAGGAHSLDDLNKVKTLSGGKVDLTIGSALDIFGGNKVKYTDCVAFNHSQSRET